MKHLKKLLTTPLLQVPRKVVALPLVVALLGFADASYLAIEHFQGTIPPCSIGGCATVLTSAYSTISGIPIALLGALYYLVILVGLFAYIDARNQKILRFTLILTTFGFLMSLWLVFVQAFILKSFCLYCLASAGTSTLLFILALVIFSKYRVPATLSE